MGVGYSHDEGVMAHERHKQLTLNLSDELKITDYFRTGIVFNGYRAQLPVERGVFGAILAAPIAPVFNEAYGLYHTTPDFHRSQVHHPFVDIESRDRPSAASRKSVPVRVTLSVARITH